jgi:hypothetical protein
LLLANFTSVTTTVTTTTMPSTPVQWLQEFELERYVPALEQNGYDSLHLVSVIEESDLDTLGIVVPTHRKLFLVKVKDLYRRLNANVFV